MNGPALTVVLASVETDIWLEGVNVQAGDAAFWTSASQTACNSVGVDIFTMKDAGDGVVGTFAFGSAAASWQLCYRFNYLGYSGSSTPSPTDWMLFSAVRVVTISSLSPLPLGLIIGCAPVITVTGIGFTAASELAAQCLFGDYGATKATYVSDNALTCAAPNATSPGTARMTLQFGSNAHAPQLAVYDRFSVYDETAVVVNTVTPGGGSYDLEATVNLTGRTVSLGAPAFRFSNFSCDTTTLSDPSGGYFTRASCEKPAFSGSGSDVLGVHPIEFTPDGECWVPTGASFTVFNAQIDSISPLGAPSDVSIVITVAGRGFVVGLEGGVCSFRNEADATAAPIHTTLSPPNTTTEATCNSPAGEVVATYAVAVMLNGRDAEPVLLGSLSFSEYDVSSVELLSVQPRGSPKAVATSVTVSGGPFVDYGAGQLVCAAGSTTTPGQLLDGSNVLCPLPSTLAEGFHAVNISLSAGEPGTWTSQVDYYVYPQPNVTRVEVGDDGQRRLSAAEGVTKLEGPARGGTPLVISGVGFLSLPSHLAMPSCRFMGRNGPTSPASIDSDTSISCLTTWGMEASDGQLVGVALNGVHFVDVTGAANRFFFVGLHSPKLVDVYFTTDATRMVVQFDPQPTNRGESNGNVPCHRLVDADTFDLLQGRAPRGDPVQCAFVDDSQMVVYLTMFTHASSGMRVGLKADTFWPKLYKGPCQPADEEDSLCNEGTSMLVDSFSPCNTRATEVEELCSPPVAVLQAPEQIGVCPGTSFQLDASQSYGGGAKLLNYTWGLTLDSDNRRSILSFLSSVSSQ